MWVKICGMTCPEDAQLAFDAGADAIGLNFVGGPRQIDLAAAPAILAAVPSCRTAFALVRLGPDGVDPGVDALLTRHAIRCVQAYGDASPSNLRRLIAQGRRPLVVCRPDVDNLRASIDAALGGLTSADVFALLLDAFAPGQLGGTGRTLDWDALAQARARGELEGLPPIVLAGGLNSANVRHAITRVAPWGLDVVSGVEARPGHKDPQAVADFVRAAKAM